MKLDQIDVLAATVFRRLQKVDDTIETRTSRQLWSDVGETDRQNRIHFDLTLFHAVAHANRDVGAHPYPDTTGDDAPSHAVPEPFGEDHALKST